jgi:FHS family L-fucose permease-like MFS transporter
MQSTVSNTRTRQDRSVPVLPRGQLLPFALITAAFFLWGMSNNLTDILVQQFRKSFELSLFQAQLVQTANYLAYGLMAIPAALLTRRFGYKSGLLLGLCVFAAGTLLFWPAAIIGRYSVFLVALFTVGCGLSILETTANPMVAQFGDPRTSERRLNYAQAMNPPGTILGLLFGTWFIFSGIEKTPAQVETMKATGSYTSYLHSEILRVVPTYVALGAAVLLLAAAIALTRFPSDLATQLHTDPELDPRQAPRLSDPRRGSFRTLLQYPHFLFAVLTQFAYLGAQVGTWSNLIPYLKAYTSASERTAGYLLTLSLVALAIGRFATVPLMRLISPARIIAVYAALNIALVLVGIAHPGLLGGYALMTTSLFMSVMYPTIFALGIKDLGPNTKLGGSFLVMAILGGAILPLVMGYLRDRTGSPALAFVVPLLGYVAVLLFGLFGARPTTAHDVTRVPRP